MHIDIETPSLASSVDAPRCGVNKIFFAFNNGLFFLIGSFSKTSIAAPAIKFLLRALAKSVSFINPPLATLIIRDVFFIILNLS